jgi:hypothetical protein
MYVKDLNGERLRLTSLRLEEIRGSEVLCQPWYLLLKDLRRAVKDNRSRYESGVCIRLRERARIKEIGQDFAERTWDRNWLRMMKKDGFMQSFDFLLRRIGCRNFSEEEFAKILRAAKIPVSS